ncbi:MAG: hypothetical protein IVW51_07550 [Thermaceae bacterium]|nr:hypothetical protein [Thermaceae bacterium]
MGLHHLLEGLLRAQRGHHGHHRDDGHGYGHNYGHRHEHDYLPRTRLLACPDCGHAFGGLKQATVLPAFRHPRVFARPVG